MLPPKLSVSRANIANLDSTVRFHNSNHATQAAGNSEFYFDGSTHKLYFDDDGTGSHTAILVATLTGVGSLASDGSDISVVNKPIFDDII